MNRRLRVLLIGRHFWPHGSIDSAAFLFQLACALHRHGVGVEVMSPRYASSWPEQLTIREIPVHRPAAAPRSDWSMGRYVRHLTSWLRQHANSYDVLLVDAIREEATAAIEAARTAGCPVILRSAGWGAESDPSWWRTSRSARKCGLIGTMADAVIAKSAACQRALIADGYAASRVHRIDHGFSATPVTSQSRKAARRSLATVNTDLVTEDESPVLLCRCRMTRDSGAQLLVKSARRLIDQHPNLRLWLVGDGPHRDWMYESLRGDGIRASIAMPGSFSDSEDLLAAADVYLQPDENGLDYFLPSAIAAEVPVVVVDNESTRSVIAGGNSDRGGRNRAQAQLSSSDPSSYCQWVPGATSKLVRVGLLRVLDDLPGYRRKAAHLRRLLLRSRPQSDAIHAYVSLMEQLMRDKSSRRQRSSAEAV